MNFTHRFSVDASLKTVVNFHRQSASMGRITPPPIVARIHSAPEQLSEGDEMRFTLWMGPLPLRWHARIENVTPNGFVDRQLDGPFDRWVHRHIFVPDGESRTTVVDVVDAKLNSRPIWKLLGLGMWVGMPALFAYRGWKTKRLLRSCSGNQAVHDEVAECKA